MPTSAREKYGVVGAHYSKAAYSITIQIKDLVCCLSVRPINSNISAGKHCSLLHLIPLPEHKGGGKSREERRRDASRRGGELAREHTCKAVLVDGFSHALGERVSEARERHGSSRAREVGERTVESERREHDSRDDIARENARGGELGEVDEKLSYGADSTADEESPDNFGHSYSFTRWMWMR